MEIPPVVIDRLPLYTRALSALESEAREVVSSQELGTRLGVTPAQIRKDLSYFGRFGKQGRGYNVRKLLDELQRILGLDRQWRMALVGVGKRFNSLTVKSADDLESVLSANPVDVGIVAVPAEIAQNVINTLIKCGVRAILNYAPTADPRPP